MALSDDEPLTEEWLAEVGFKYRAPQERQPFKHWIINIVEKNDDGLYVETTMGGVINRHGKHIGSEYGWFLWVGRGRHHFHLRHIFNQSEMIAVIEALSGHPWNPDNHAGGQVWDKLPLSYSSTKTT